MIPIFLSILMNGLAIADHPTDGHQITVTVDGSTYQCGAGGGGGAGLSTFCRCTDSNSNQLFLVGINAEGQKVLETLLYDYDAPEKCAAGMATNLSCRKNGSASLLSLCRCTDSNSNQLFIDFYNGAGKLVTSELLVDYDAPEKCQEGMTKHLSCG